MGTPTTRIPRQLRASVRLAFECWRDYLVAIDNGHGATFAEDVVRALGLEPLEKIAGMNRFKYADWRIKRMVEDREKYGPR